MGATDRWRDLIRAEWPELAVDRIEVLPHLGWGGDSDAVLVNGELVFRFPRGPEVVRALAVEICLLPRLGRRVPVAIPDFQYIAVDPASGRPRFVGYRAISGQPLTAERLAAVADAGAVARLAAALAAFLSALHTFPVDEARACGAPAPFADGRTQLEHYRAMVEEIVFPALDARTRQVLDRQFTDLLADDRAGRWPAVVCHGDLSTDHILATVPGAEGTASRGGPAALTGIIDFGDVCIGDPTGEFLWRFDYGEDFYRAVLDAYTGPIVDRVAFDRVVAFRHRVLPTVEIAYGVATGNAGYVAEGRRELERRLGLGEVRRERGRGA